MVLDRGALRLYPSPIDSVLIESPWRLIESIDRVETLSIQYQLEIDRGASVNDRRASIKW